MEPVTKQALQDLSIENSKKLDYRIVDQIVGYVYNRVLHVARRGLGSRVTWDTRYYMFEGVEDIKLTHVVLACVRLQELFPDCKVVHPTPLEIRVDWS